VCACVGGCVRERDRERVCVFVYFKFLPDLKVCMYVCVGA